LTGWVIFPETGTVDILELAQPTSDANANTIATSKACFIVSSKEKDLT
jgi:hypothetical protein